MWRVNVAGPARKALNRFPTFDRERITAALDQMAADPFSADVRKLGGASYRRRVGSYRIFFDLYPPLRFLQVTAITRRPYS
jgi:mRNA-degrading endonuclease RelE of RelBE toxin-antitoxin system